MEHIARELGLDPLEFRLKNALRAGEGRGGGPERDDVLVWLKRDPVYDPLRPHPRFQALLKRIALP